MKRIILFLSLALLPAAHAEPLNYDYVYLSSNDAEGDTGDSGETAGAFWEFAETLHLFGSYDTGGNYTGSGSNPAWDYDTRTIRAGAGGHYLLGTRFMLAPSIAVLRSRREVYAPALGTRMEYTDTGYGVQLDLRYAVADWIELTAGARSSRIFDDTRSDFLGGIIFHPTDWLAMGVVRHEGEDDASTEFTVRWYY